MAKIMIVEDERSIRVGFKRIMEGEGYEVIEARDGIEALEKFGDGFDGVVLLDVMMPKLNGFKTCEEMRRRNRTATIIFLTAMDTEADEVRGIGLGADDYISKTASASVLIARVQRAVKREEERRTRLGTKLKLGKSVEVDFARMRVREGTEERSLTQGEAEVLMALNERRGDVVSSEELTTHLHGKDFIGSSLAIRVIVSRLRSKLGSAADYVANIPKVGYFLVRDHL